MYRGILGDCFLVRAFVETDGKTTVKSMLIDCGVLQNVASGTEMYRRLDPAIRDSLDEQQTKKLTEVVDGQTRIRQVARDVLDTVDGHIDLLVVTHEHYDHLSGFGFSRDAFLDKNVTIDRLWMAWTENFADPQASSLRARLSKGRKALAAAADLSHSMGADAPEALANAASLAAFVGPANSEAGLAVGSQFGTGSIMQMLKDKVGRAATDYLEPGQVIDLEQFGMKAYVLGPPRNENLLRKDMPSAGTAREVYITRTDAAVAAESTASTRLQILETRAAEPAEFAEITPFSAAHLSPIRDGKRQSAKSGTRAMLESMYEEPLSEWRKIDNVWTESIEAMALKMDSDTNNTSLVLAFELPDGQVLLFPGDAQVGNWLSWNDQLYPKTKPRKSSVNQVTAEDLLRRVTFYKGAHHLSHNATAKAAGLERMTDPRLVAAAPLVEALAAIQGKGRKAVGMGWKMPYPDLYKALNEKTHGRIVRGDGVPEDEEKTFAANPTATVRPVTIEHEKECGLWVELTFEMA